MPNVLRRRSSRGGRVRRGHPCEGGGGSEGVGGVTCWCHSPADSCRKRSKSPPAANGPISPQRRLIERMDLFLRRGTLSGGGRERLCHFVALHTEPHGHGTDPHPLPSPRPLVSARARGQVLSHGRHNWPND